MPSPQEFRAALDAQVAAYVDGEVRPKVAALLVQANRRASRHRIRLRQGMGTWSFFIDGEYHRRWRNDELTEGCQGVGRNDRAKRYAARFPELVEAAALVDYCYDELGHEIGDID